MISTMVDYKKRLGMAIKASNLSLKVLAKEVGVSYQAVKKVVDGDSRAFNAENHARAAKALKVSSDWLALGEGESKRKDDASLNRNTVLVPNLVPAAASETIDTSKLQDEARADGLLANALPLSRAWAEQLLRPSAVSALRYLYAQGDSMQGTFDDGDLLLVDTGVNAISEDGIFVLMRHERLLVKRITQRGDGSLEITSDNPGIKTVDVLKRKAPVPVLGRVLWAFVGKKL